MSVTLPHHWGNYKIATISNSAFSIENAILPMAHHHLDFTVAIPTYNGAKRIGEVLDKLRAQVNVESLNWEILIIDNNSQDNTAQIIQAYQANWLHPYALKYYQETKQGAGFARERAVQEANSPLIGFLDDDNLPALNWVGAAYDFCQQYPQAGAISSRVKALWEGDTPVHLERILPFLAINERGFQPLLYHPQSRLLPPSAGLVVRKSAWLESVPEHCILRGRVTGKMLTSEDLEVLAYIQKTPWEIWYNPSMEIEHKIPNWRLQRDYLIPFMEGIGLSRYVTRMIGVKPWQKPFLLMAYFANDLRKIIMHFFKYGREVKTDLATACEMQLFISSFISPFYLWTNGYLD